MTKLVGNKSHRARLRRSIKFIHTMWSGLCLDPASKNDSWYRYPEKQALRDALHGFKVNGLVEDYDTHQITFAKELQEKNS